MEAQALRYTLGWLSSKDPSNRREGKVPSVVHTIIFAPLMLLRRPSAKLMHKSQAACPCALDNGFTAQQEEPHPDFKSHEG